MAVFHVYSWAEADEEQAKDSFKGIREHLADRSVSYQMLLVRDDYATGAGRLSLGILVGGDLLGADASETHNVITGWLQDLSGGTHRDDGTRPARVPVWRADPEVFEDLEEEPFPGGRKRRKPWWKFW